MANLERDKFIRKIARGGGRNISYRDVENFVDRYPEHFEKIIRKNGKMFIYFKNILAIPVIKIETPHPDKHVPLTYIKRFVNALKNAGLIPGESDEDE